MNNDIPAFFEDIEPIHEIEFDNLSVLTDEEKTKYGLLYETHRVPEAERFSFLQHAISFFALGIDTDDRVKSAVLIIDDAGNGAKMYDDLVRFNGEPPQAVTIQGEAVTADSPATERLQHRSFTWHLGRSAMTFSLSPANENQPAKQLTRIHLRIIE